MSNVVTREIEYEADGARLVGHYVTGQGAAAAQPRGAGALKRPGVLVAHSGPGLSEQAKSVAHRLAEAGYAAFALDYHGGGKVLTDIPDMMSRLNRFLENPDFLRARIQKALDVLVAQPEVDGSKVAAIGYCFGGTSVLELARSGAPVGVTVGFHSGLKTVRPQDAANIKGKVLVCLGADDPLITQADRNAFEQEMRAGAVDCQMHVYSGVLHSFTEPSIEAQARAVGMGGMKYDEAADRRSWRSMLDLFDDVFGRRPGAAG